MFIAVWVLGVSPLLAQSPSSPKKPDPPIAVRAPPSKAITLPPVSSLFRDLARDVQRLPSLENAVVLGVGGASSLAIRNHDRRITTHLALSATLDRVFEPGAVLGGGYVHGGAAVATYALGRLTRNPKAATVGADLVRAQILTGVLTHSLKFSVGRARPDGGKYSFPSGHSSSSFASASVLGRHFGWKVAVPAHSLAAYVAVSRLQESRHFLSDVAFGAAVGVVAGRTVTIGRGPAQFAVTPVAAPGLTGVTFVWRGKP